MIAEQVRILVVDEFVDDVELVVVGVDGAHEFLVGALVAEKPAVLGDVGNLVATGPSVGLVFEVAESEVGELNQEFFGSVSGLIPRDWPAKGARFKQDVFQHGVSPKRVPQLR
jgi:hypothetical protein